MDEAWRFIQHETLRAYVEEALKTWRKRNASMLLATQTTDDFASADLLRTVVESCPTKLLLANPALDRRQYAELFQLNETELDLLAGLMPRAAAAAQAPGARQGADPERRSAVRTGSTRTRRSTTNACERRSSSTASTPARSARRLRVRREIHHACTSARAVIRPVASGQSSGAAPSRPACARSPRPSAR